LTNGKKQRRKVLMKIILPTAGKGTRLRPHTHTKAKSLVHVAGKTVLSISSNALLRLTPRNTSLSTMRKTALRSWSSWPIIFPISIAPTIQNERLGPAHAVALAASRIQPGDDVLVVFNDTIFVTDLERIQQICADCDGLIYSKEVEDYQRFGVNVVDEAGFIVDMVEKPETPVSRLAQVGLYYLKDGRGFMEFLGENHQGRRDGQGRVLSAGGFHEHDSRRAQAQGARN
jgi:glucose-1-phosphate thymidylyltransferase